jgi:2'-5' RNA ligase
MSPTLISDLPVPAHPEAGWSGNFGAPFPRRSDEPRPSDPVFFALRPTEIAAAQMTRLARDLFKECGLEGQPTEKARLHATLLGPYCYAKLSPATRGAIDQAASSLRMPAFRAGFDCAMSFGRKKGPLVLCGSEGVAGITMLQHEFAVAMRWIGLRGPKPRRPHVTLRYEDCDVPERFVEEIGWVVRDLVLICSLRGRHRHIELARWPLRPAC